ncbi:MAG: OB-fold nucleic acid binding domain-containing protein, partial [Candidatus Zixiibacteriota bacterium]
MTKDNKEHTQHHDNQPGEVHLPLADLVKIRRDKVLNFQKQGVTVYPYKYARTHSAKELLEKFDDLSAAATIVSIAGRIMLKRDMGKASFAHVSDQSGKIQIYLKMDIIGESEFKQFVELDLGDIVGCEGALFTTKTGEKTLRVSKYEILCKSLH